MPRSVTMRGHARRSRHAVFRPVIRFADRSLPPRVLAALAAAVVAAGCGSAGAEKTTSATETSPVASPARLARPAEVARAERAVHVLARAVRGGDVHRLCRPGAVFTSAVVAGMKAGGQSCEASLELSNALLRPPALTVTRLVYRPGLAAAQVRVGRDRVIPLDLVHARRRWLVSFSDGDDPIVAIGQ